MKKLFYILYFVFVYLYINSSVAQEYNIFKMDMVEVNYISSINNINSKKDFHIGLKFNLQPDWKIYWRQPGDSGMPPEINYSKSKNLNKFELEWPYPVKEYESLDLLTNVYKNEVILPIKISIQEVGKALELNTELNFQVCKDICIPLQTNLFLNINSGKSEFTNDLYVIEKAISKIPVIYQRAGIKNIKISSLKPKSLLLHIESNIKLSNDNLVVFLENNKEYIKISDIRIRSEDSYRVVAELFFDKIITDINTFQITIVKGDLVAYADSIKLDTEVSGSILIILFLAFLGGFILNFMPCVLPVLTLKITHILNHNYTNKFDVRLNFLLTTLGIVFSFICLALMAIIVKYFGGEVGWGIQFQQPIFIFFLILILIVFSLNLFNFIEISLPSKLSSYINNYVQDKKYGKAFFEGAFATLLATPCSAPFLGTAVSFALASNAYIILAVFLFLGLGMALPYILFIIFPSLVKLLPKPGKWMTHLKYVLASGLILTAIWLAYVCALIIGMYLFIIFSICLILFILLSLCIFNKKYIHRYKYFLVLLIICNIFLIYDYMHIDSYNYDYTASNDWVDYDNESLINYIKNGDTVFIDITAEWCITCKINKLLVMNSNEFRKFVARYNIILMRGDWTKPNIQITQFLQKANRYGIPFNAIYGKNFPKGIVFPEILNLDDIIDGYNKMHISYAD